MIKEYLLNYASGFVYSTALSPLLLGPVSEAGNCLPDLEEPRKKLKEKAKCIRKYFREQKYNIGLCSTHIIPIILGCSDYTLSVQKKMREQGIIISAIRPPSVPTHTALLRLSLAIYHTEEDIERLNDALRKIL